jgi:hypothetical protein
MQWSSSHGSTQKSVYSPFPTRQVIKALKKALEMLSVATGSSDQGLERSHRFNQSQRSRNDNPITLRPGMPKPPRLNDHWAIFQVTAHFPTLHGVHARPKEAAHDLDHGFPHPGQELKTYSHMDWHRREGKLDYGEAATLVH